MDTSPFVAIGQQFQDFLTKQFSPPPGTKCELGFLGSGIAVAPESFLSQGQFNPARVNTWLSIVTDPIHTIIDGRVAPTQLTATQLMQAICSFAKSAAPAGSDTATTFAKLKNQAMENLGGMMGLSAAPLDWYDPTQIPRWSHCSLTTSTTNASHEATLTPPHSIGDVPPHPPLWTWRRLSQVALKESVTTSPPIPTAARLGTSLPRELSQLNLSDIAAHETATVISHQLLSLDATDLSRIAQAAGKVKITSIEQLPNISITVDPKLSSASANAQVSSRAIAVSSTISQAAEQAITSSVDSSSLSINLSYLFVDLSRMPWWNELLITTFNNWYVPGQQRATFVADAISGRSIGVPVALVLTNNVQLQGMWSQSDLSALSSNTHIGPWALSGYQMTATDSSRQATLTLPGMQAIACIFRLLPPLPPLSDPSLPTGV